jgi:superfamily I DNA/RNA helicase
VNSAFDSLSKRQREIVFEKSGKFIVRACPGSGKTYSVAARLARCLGNWNKKYQGIATISFTNAAWQEIDHQLKTHFGITSSVTYPHFLGTIDSFINQHIFLPFGHLVLGCNKRPELVGEPYGSWFGRGYHESLFDNISFDVNGEPIIFDPRRMPKYWQSDVNVQKKVLSKKRGLLRKGFAIQRDADYFAMKVLEEYSQIASVLAYRYPVMIIDEAQDTSDIQMRIIDLLIENGLEEIMIVGDPDQAIFEWNKAKPELFKMKHEEWKDNSVDLNENRRSSQKICNCTFRLSSLKCASLAITDEVKDYPFVPEIITYDPERIDKTIDYFLDLCGEHAIEVTPKNVAIIYRSRDILRSITGTGKIRDNLWTKDYHTKDIAKGKYLYEKGEIKKGFQFIEKAFLKMLSGKTVCTKDDIAKRTDDIGLFSHRKQIFEIINMLPAINCTIGDWIKKANKYFACREVDKTLSIKSTYENYTFDQLFNEENEVLEEKDYRLGTVHSVKGETFEAVLLFLKKKGPRSSYYNTLIVNNSSPSNHEELRIVYVGMTRPRKLLVLAVPDEENSKIWKSILL